MTDFGVRPRPTATTAELAADLIRLIDRLIIEIDDLKRRVAALGG